MTSICKQIFEDVVKLSGIICFLVSLSWGQKSVAVLNVKSSQLGAEDCIVVTNFITAEMQNVSGYQILAWDDISSMLEHQAGKQQVSGCDDDECIAEIGGALGVSYIVAGDIGRIGNRYICNLKLIDIEKAVACNRVSQIVVGDLGKLTDYIPEMVGKLFNEDRHEVGMDRPVTAVKPKKSAANDPDIRGSTSSISALKTRRKDHEISPASERKMLISSEKLIVLQPGPGEAQDCNTQYSYDRINHSSWQNHNNGLNSIFGVGTYDQNTVIRALVRFNMPDSLQVNQLKTAKLVLCVNNWVNKDVDSLLPINVHKMLRSWKQGNYYGGFYDKGRNSSYIDGATALERFWGNQDGSEKWSRAGVGMNDIDASVKVYTTSAKEYGDYSPWEFEITELVREWLKDKQTNFGMLLRTPLDQGEEGRNYSYPDFWSGDNKEKPQLRPSLILELK